MFVRMFFHLVENPSLTSGSLFVHLHNAHDRCTAAAFTITMPLIAVLLLFCPRTTSLFFFFLSFYSFHCVFFFKSSPSIPIFCSVDPNIVVLNPEDQRTRTPKCPVGAVLRICVLVRCTTKNTEHTDNCQMIPSFCCAPSLPYNATTLPIHHSKSSGSGFF